MDSRSKICELRRQNPAITQAKMASEIGISRERVRQLLKSMQVPSISKEQVLDIAPVLLWIIEEMVRPPESGMGIPRQMSQFRTYAERVVATAKEAMTSNPTRWERYLIQTGGTYVRNESTK
jgi:DNA-binding XRE family transcriptional regulator